MAETCARMCATVVALSTTNLATGVRDEIRIGFGIDLFFAEAAILLGNSVFCHAGRTSEERVVGGIFASEVTLVIWICSSRRTTSSSSSSNLGRFFGASNVERSPTRCATPNRIDSLDGVQTDHTLVLPRFQFSLHVFTESERFVLIVSSSDCSWTDSI